MKQPFNLNGVNQNKMVTTVDALWLAESIKIKIYKNESIQYAI